MELEEIRNILRSKANKKTKDFWKKNILSKDKLYGTKVAEINKVIQKIKELEPKLIFLLWNSNYFEEKILAIKLFKKVPKKYQNEIYKKIPDISKNITDWAVCDTLAIQGLREIATKKEILILSKKLLKSKNLWQRRLAIVSLINLVNSAKLRQEIKEILNLTNNEQEYYVKKAIIWLKKQLKKGGKK